MDMSALTTLASEPGHSSVPGKSIFCIHSPSCIAYAIMPLSPSSVGATTPYSKAGATGAAGTAMAAPLFPKSEIFLYLVVYS